jgi:hypothetical protein
MTQVWGSYISQDPIGLFGDNPALYGYVKDVNDMVDTFGLFKNLKPTGAGHHLFPRSIGEKLGIRNIIEGVKWYPDIPENTASLHQELHAQLSKEGIPFHGSSYGGTLDEALDSMERAYKVFDANGYLMVDGKNMTAKILLKQWKR